MNNKNKKINNKVQSREIVITEFSEGKNTEYVFDATMWKMRIPKKEAVEFFEAWLNGLLHENDYFDNSKPRILEVSNR